MGELEFPCDRCGSCCRNLGKVPELKGLDRGDGICRYLDLDTNLCTIYNRRPLLCRVGESYQLLFRDRYSWEEFLRENRKVCRQLQRERGWTPPEPDNPS